jgi:hypothetical protein
MCWALFLIGTYPEHQVIILIYQAAKGHNLISFIARKSQRLIFFVHFNKIDLH